MRVLKADIDRAEGYHNAMRLQVLVDHIPTLDEMRFEMRNGLWYAELDGYVKYLAHSGEDKNQGGFCGDHYNITLIDGSKKVLKGPWSSRSECANLMGFGPCIEVSITDEAETFERGYTFYVGAITVEAASKALKAMGRTKEGFVPVLFREESQYTPAFIKPWGWEFHGGEIITREAVKGHESEGIEDNEEEPIIDVIEEPER